MEAKDLLPICIYYKGENESKMKTPEDNTLWLYERAWVRSMLDKEDTLLNNYLDDYLFNGLAEFCMFDNVPITLKALLYNRYVSTGEINDVEGFKEWYITNYSH